jgi:hypothetical protein
MTKYQAHVILNEVREGVIHPQSVVLKALVTTGDIDGRCFYMGNHHVVRDMRSPYSHSVSVHLPVLEG